MGALKQSHVGVALLNNVKNDPAKATPPPPEEVEEKAEANQAPESVYILHFSRFYWLFWSIREEKLARKGLKKRSKPNAPVERKVKPVKVNSKRQARTFQVE